MNWKCCFNVIERWVARKMVKWKTGLSCRSRTAVIGKQVNFGLEINMNDFKGIRQYIFLLFHLKELLKLYVNLLYRFCVTLLFLEIF